MSASDYQPLPVPPNPAGNGSPTIVSATAPPVKQLGTTWLNTGTGTLSVWTGAAWVQIAGGGGAGLPAALEADQILVSDVTLAWVPGDLDQGRY